MSGPRLAYVIGSCTLVSSALLHSFTLIPLNKGKSNVKTHSALAFDRCSLGMVASKKIHCALCNKKCSGNVLRYQDHYYHKQCFELEQSEGLSRRSNLQTAADMAPPDLSAASDSSNNSANVHSPDSLSRKQNLSMSQPEVNGRSPSASPRLFGLVGRPKPQVSSKPADLERRARTIDNRNQQAPTKQASDNKRSATLPHSLSSPSDGFQNSQNLTCCAGCGQFIKDGQALVALDLHWHVWCFKCTQCQVSLHGEYVAKEGKAYCEKDYQKLFGVTCVYCKRYITGKVLQAGEAHHFHPSCARCSKCGDPFVPGEEMYLQGEVTWHPRCGPGPDNMSPAGIFDDFAVDSSTRSQVSAS